MFIGKDHTVEEDPIRQSQAQSCVPSHGLVADIAHGQSGGAGVLQKKSIGGEVKIASVGVSPQTHGEHCLDDDEAQNRVSLSTEE